jgi:hypothetical protein
MDICLADCKIIDTYSAYIDIGANDMIYELCTQFDSRDSFGGKAKVIADNGKETLVSYCTPVVEFSNGKVKLLTDWNKSQTTVRHVKEYLCQKGLINPTDGKAEIMKKFSD